MSDALVLIDGLTEAELLDLRRRLPESHVSRLSVADGVSSVWLV